MRRLLLLTLTLALASGATAQTPKPTGPRTPPPGMAAPPPDDPLNRFFFPPELIMQHQSDIGLSDAQRNTISKEIQAAQAKFVDMQWKMSGEMEKFTRLLSSTPVDEAQALEELDRILAAERDVKKTQVTLLVRIKNALTRDQQARLEMLRDHRPDDAR